MCSAVMMMMMMMMMMMIYMVVFMFMLTGCEPLRLCDFGPYCAQACSAIQRAR